jgi:TatA/E family protein of Tat protein translocase
MGPIGVPELIIIFVVALLVFGPRKLPELGKSLGRGLSEFRRASNELRNTLEEEVRVIDHETSQTGSTQSVKNEPLPTESTEGRSDDSIEESLSNKNESLPTESTEDRSDDSIEKSLSNNESPSGDLVGDSVKEKDTELNSSLVSSSQSELDVKSKS